jgi:hypothetical protein
MENQPSDDQPRGHALLHQTIPTTGQLSHRKEVIAELA